MYTSPAKQKLNLHDQSDAVGKLRVSNPQALIDTDFEYGLQGTKWETIELVNGYQSAGYRPSEPAYAGLVGSQRIISIVGSPDQVGNGTGGFRPNGTMRVTVATPPSVPFAALNPITVKYTGTSIASFADTTDGTGVITAVINPTTFEYKANTTAFQSTITQQATEQTIIYTGQWLTGALQPINRLITFGGTCSAVITTCNNAGAVRFNSFMPGIQFTLIHPLSTNDIRYPWCGNFSVDGQPNVGSFDNSVNNGISVCFYTLSTFASSPATRTIVSSVTDGLSCVMNPTGYITHRYLDGGVQMNTSSPYSPGNTVVPSMATLGTGIPRENTIIRQTRKYFRYQSGKSIQFSTGINFRPVIEPMTWGPVAAFNPPGEPTRMYIQLTFDFDHGVLGQYSYGTGSRLPYITPPRIRLSGFDSQWSLLNGDFTVSRVIASNQLWVDLGPSAGSPFNAAPYTTSSAIGSPKLEVLGWYDATVRTGLFDDLNGVFWEYDGINLNVVRRTSTQQLNGKFQITQGGTSLASSVAVGRLNRTIFPGSTINIKGQVHKHQLYNSASNTVRNVYPPYRGPSIASASGRMSFVTETRIKQSEFNLDKLDGTGPSGYTIDLGKMQMVFIDYSWYGAGKIRYGVRASDGNIVWCHEILNNNTNTEAYMKSGNLPARFELSTNSRPFEVLVGPEFSGANVVANTFPETYYLSAYAADSAYLPASGSIFCNNEVVNYIKTNTSTQLVQLSVTNRWQPGGQRRETASFTTASQYGGSIATYDRVFSINQNCSPTLSHWGTSVIMDGNFDKDKSYLFTAASLSATIVPVNAEIPIISIRLAPSVDTGIPANFGVRAQNNRSQLSLDSLGVAVAGQGQIVLRVNPQSNTFVSRISGWTNVGGGSLAQYFDHSVQEPRPNNPLLGGEIVGAFFCQQTTGTSYEVTPITIDTTRELGNSIIGGDNAHPDGPDILTVSIKNISTSNIVLSGFARITWTEAQG